MEETKNLLKLWNEVKPAAKGTAQKNSVQQAEKIASLFATGPFYYFIFNLFELKVNYIHPNVQNILGISPDDFSIGQYLKSIDPEQIKHTYLKEEAASRFLYQELPPEKILHYKVVYINKLRTAGGAYKTILHQAIPLELSKDHKIGQLLCIHSDVSHLEFTMDHKVSFIGLKGEPSFLCLHPENPSFIKEDLSQLYTPHEFKILALIAEGYSSAEIASRMNISILTVSTHRKRILSKTNCRNIAELVAKCIKAGLI